MFILFFFSIKCNDNIDYSTESLFLPPPLFVSFFLEHFLIFHVAVCLKLCTITHYKSLQLGTSTGSLSKHCTFRTSFSSLE